MSDLQALLSARKEALEQANGNWKTAAAILKAHLLADEELYHLVIDPLLDRACYAQIAAEASMTRGSLWAEPGRQQEPTTDGLVALARVNLLDYPLAGGLRLGDAVGDQIAANAVRLESHAKGTLRSARWLRLIVAALPEGARAEDVLTHNDLARLQQQASEDGGGAKVDLQFNVSLPRRRKERSVA